ncbi:MAG: ABC transporter permease subunit, partial [Rhodobacteraceae bacterium]|nr:ABC transporter permease subunit [Paracoccaceae bacterium]
MNQRPTFLVTILGFGFAFLYVPILSMIFFSFNNSRLATIWGGFSTKWYGKLLENDKILDAVKLSIEIALISATTATILGTMTGIALARFRSFRGRTVLSGLVTAPLIMPEVITGISSLIFFILIALVIEKVTGIKTQRGFTTVTLAHITFTLTFVTTIVQSRLMSADISVEEAAMDLGSRPWQVMKDITLPIISPAILSGWLLAFTISLDDVVITQFTTGPGTTTLPILIYSKVKLGVTPDINALATIIVSIVSIGVIATGIVMNRKE